MSAYTLSERSIDSWQSASWSDGASTPRPRPEPEFMLELNNGASIPLKPTSRKGVQQVFCVDESLNSRISISIDMVAGTTHPTVDKSWRRLQRTAWSMPHSPLLDYRPRNNEGQLTHMNAVPTERPRADQVQARIDAITAAHVRQPAPSLCRNGVPMPILSAVVASNPETTMRYNHRSTASGRDATNDNKIYCTYWIRHGECDYMQQGCRYRHEMPGLKTLRSIGFQNVPRWYREKTSIAAASPLRPKPEFRQMIESGTVDSSNASESDLTSDTGSDHMPSPASCQRSPLMTGSTSPISIIEKANIQYGPPGSSRTQPQDDTSDNKPDKTDSLMHDVRMDPNDPADGKMPPSVPQNSPESSAFRKGRFIPAGEELSIPVLLHTTPRGIPYKSAQPILSPFRLGPPKNAPPSIDLSSSRKSVAPKVASPQVLHYSKCNPAATVSDLKQKNASTRPQSPLTIKPPLTIEHARLQQENEALKAQMKSLTSQQRSHAANHSEVTQSAQPSANWSLSYTGLMGSKHRAADMDPRPSEEKDKSFCTLSKGRDNDSRANTSPNGSLKPRKHVTQIVRAQSDTVPDAAANITRLC